MKRLKIVWLVLLLVGLTACRHRTLEELSDAHYIRVYVNEKIRNITFGFYDKKAERPEWQLPRV